MQSWLNRISPQLNILWRGGWPPHFIEPARSLYDHELVFVTKGKFSLQVEDSHYEMGAGSFALIPPQTNHVSVASRGSVQRSCIHFDWIGGTAFRRPICAYAPQKAMGRLVVKTPPCVPVRHKIGCFDLQGAVPALLETIFLRWQGGDAFQRSLCRGPFLELLVQLFWDKSKLKRQRSAASQLAYAAKECLDFQSQDGASVCSLLSSLGYSYPHVSRLFHKSFGVTPVEYLNAQKLERAKTLLRHPRLSIADVAYQSGFHDPGYFIRKFRQQTGLTPRQYRYEII